MQREVSAPLLRGSAGTESGPQPFSASSDRYYFVGVEANVIQKSFDTSGNPGDELRQDSDHMAHTLNGSNMGYEFTAQGNRPEMHWLYDMNQGAGLTANTALFLGSAVTGGDVGANPECPDCCPAWWCDCDFRYCRVPEDCLSLPVAGGDESDPPDCPEKGCKFCWKGCGDELAEMCPYLFGWMNSDMYYKVYTGDTDPRRGCVEDQVEKWKPRCQGNEEGYEGCCRRAGGPASPPQGYPQAAPFDAAWAKGGCCPGCVAGGDDCCTREGTMSGCGCGNGGSNGGNGDGGNGAHNGSGSEGDRLVPTNSCEARLVDQQSQPPDYGNRLTLTRKGGFDRPTDSEWIKVYCEKDKKGKWDCSPKFVCRKKYKRVCKTIVKTKEKWLKHCKCVKKGSGGKGRPTSGDCESLPALGHEPHDCHSIAQHLIDKNCCCDTSLIGLELCIGNTVKGLNDKHGMQIECGNLANRHQDLVHSIGLVCCSTYCGFDIVDAVEDIADLFD